MITIYDGRLGGGKTYAAVELMVETIAAGGYVVTNVGLKFAEIDKYISVRYGRVVEGGASSRCTILEPSQVGEFYKRIPVGTSVTKVLCVIDEAHIWLNARDWQLLQRQVMIFLSQSRKVRVDLIFISQHVKNIDAQIVRLCQFIVSHRDMRQFRLPGIGLRWPFAQFMRIVRDYDGQTVYERKILPIKPEIFGLYSSDQLLCDLETAGGVTAAVLKKSPAAIRKEKMIKVFAVAAVVVLVLVGCFWHFRGNAIEMLGGAGDAVPTVAVASPAPAAPPAPSAPVRRIEPDCYVSVGGRVDRVGIDGTLYSVGDYLPQYDVILEDIAEGLLLVSSSTGTSVIVDPSVTVPARALQDMLKKMRAKNNVGG